MWALYKPVDPVVSHEVLRQGQHRDACAYRGDDRQNYRRRHNEFERNTDNLYHHREKVAQGAGIVLAGAGVKLGRGGPGATQAKEGYGGNGYFFH